MDDTLNQKSVLSKPQANETDTAPTATNTDSDSPRFLARLGALRASRKAAQESRANFHAMEDGIRMHTVLRDRKSTRLNSSHWE